MYQRSTIRYTSSGEDMWTLESMQLGGHNIQDFLITRIISHSIVLYHKTISLCKRKKHRRRWNKNILWNNRRTIRCKNRSFIQSFEKMLPEAGICTTAAHGRAGWEGSPAGEVSTHRASPQRALPPRATPEPLINLEGCRHLCQTDVCVSEKRDVVFILAVLLQTRFQIRVR